MATYKVEIERFDGTGDYTMWKARMMAHLRTAGLKDALTDEDLTLDEDTTKDSDKNVQDKVKKLDPKKVERSEQARDLIIMHVSNQVLRKINDCQTAASMWAMLDQLYTESSLPNRIYLQLRLYTYKMNDSQTVDQNVDEFLKLIADLANVGVPITEEAQAVILLSSLPYRYNQLKDTLKYGRETLSLREVIASAKSKERELGDNEKSQRGNAEGLYVEQRGRSDKWNNQMNRSRSKSKGNGKNNKGCFLCGEEGHWKRDCPQRKQRNFKHSANTVSSSQEPLVLTVSTQSTNEEWVIDSGSSFHITPNRDLLYDLEEFEGGKVLMGNNTHSEVKGKGKIRIVNPDNSEVVLTDVKYMPSMTRNLISCGLLEKSGCRYSGKNFRVSFYKKNRKVIEGKYSNGLYYLQGRVQKPEVSGLEKEVLLVEKEADQSSRMEKEEGGQLRRNKGKRVSFNSALEQSGMAENSKAKVRVQGGEPMEDESVTKVTSKEGLLRKGVKHLSSWLKGVLTTSLIFPKGNQIAIESFGNGDFVGDLDINSKSRDATEIEQLKLEKVHTSVSTTDVLTKALPGGRIEAGLLQLKIE